MYTDEQYDIASGSMIIFFQRVLETAEALAEFTPLTLTLVGPGFTDPTLQPTLGGDPFGFLLPLELFWLSPDPALVDTPKKKFDYYVQKMMELLAGSQLAKDLFDMFNGYGMPLGPFEIQPLLTNNQGPVEEV
jgi:hypothetical protein